MKNAGNLGIRGSHVIKLMANDWKEWISLLSCEPSLIAVIFIFLSFFLFLCNVFVLLFIFRADTSLFLFNLIFEKLILHIFLIIIIIIQCSGIFRNVPGCSGMFHVPDFIDGRGFLRL